MPLEPLLQNLVSVVRRRDAAVAPERVLIYRRLVHARFRGAVEVTLPRTAARLGTTAFDDEIAEFLADRASSSPFVADVAREFVVWAGDRWPTKPEVPVYLLDLARHELLWVEVASAFDDDAEAVTPDVSLDARLVFRKSAAVARYRHAVHLLSDDTNDHAEPATGETAILAYRDPDYQVRYLELSPVAAHIVERLLCDHATLKSAIFEGCAAVGVAVDDAVLGGVVAMLTDLTERGVVRGAAA